MIISSPSNPKIKELERLRKSSVRKKQGLFLIDGAREIELALKSGWEITSLFFCPSLAGDQKNLLTEPRLATLTAEKIIEVPETIFRKICYKENPDGLLAVAKFRITRLADVKLGSRPLLVILEQVEKPGNLGAILRTAYAAEVTAVIINDSQTDIYNPNVIRASEGQIFSQPVVTATVAETLAWLKAKKIKSFAAATGGAKKYTVVDLTGPAAIILGAEAEGLSPAWLKAAEASIKIPMRRGIDSLNVSVAAAIILFEALRQRAV